MARSTYHIIIFIIIIFIHPEVKGQCQIDSILQYKLSTSRNEQSDTIIVNTYDSSGQLLAQVHSVRLDSSNQYVEFKKENLEYDAHQNITRDLIWVKNPKGNETWSMRYLASFKYDKNNNLIESSAKFIPAAGSGSYEKIDLYKYNENNLKVEHTIRYWNKSLRSWIDSTQTIYEYDADSNVTFVLTLKKNLKENKWEPEKIVNNIYDKQKNIIDTYSKIWGGAFRKWMPEERITYKYNENNKIKKTIYKNWNRPGHNWINSVVISNSYDTQHNIIGSKIKRPANNHYLFAPLSRIYYRYNTQNQIIEAFYLIWEKKEKVWQPYQLYKYKYNGANKLTTEEKYWNFDATNKELQYYQKTIYRCR